MIEINNNLSKFVTYSPTAPNIVELGANYF